VDVDALAQETLALEQIAKTVDSILTPARTLHLDGDLDRPTSLVDLALEERERLIQ
jgi:hypothetical protein